jgi:hypothetical protein
MNTEIRRSVREYVEIHVHPHRRRHHAAACSESTTVRPLSDGDPATNRWAKLRADAGHPAPFNLRYLEIGNENIGEEYLAAFAAVKQAINATDLASPVC